MEQHSTCYWWDSEISLIQFQDMQYEMRKIFEWVQCKPVNL